MTLRCAILDDYQGAVSLLADWTELQGAVEPVVFHHHIDSETELVQVLREFPIVVIMRERTPFPARILEQLPNLKLLVTTGMRNASIDLEAASRLGVTVSGTGGSGSGTAELTWGLILGMARHLVQENQTLRSNGRWQSTIGSDLQGKQLGVIGLGRIGSQVARIGQAFGMEVSAWSPNLNEERAQQAGVRYADKESLLRNSDYVTVHLVLSERTRGLIGAQDLALLKPTAYLVNTSRAPIIDQEALIETLQQRRIAGAGLDVFETEPLPADHPYRYLPNVLATPHIGYVTLDGYRVFFADIAQNISEFLKGTPVRRLN